MVFQQKPLEKADFIVKITCPVMVRLASSDKWKGPLDSMSQATAQWPKSKFQCTSLTQSTKILPASQNYSISHIIK